MITQRASIDECNLSDLTPIPVNLTSRLDYLTDDIKIYGGRTSYATAHSAITASVPVASCTQITNVVYTAVYVQVIITGTGSWTIDLYGAVASAGAMAPQYDADGTPLSQIALSASRGWTWPIVGAPYIKIVPTEVVDGSTLTVFYVLIS